MDIEGWLQSLGLERYYQAFHDNDVDAEVLPQLTADDLSNLGVTSIGHRRKLLAAIASLRPGAVSARDPTRTGSTVASIYIPRAPSMRNADSSPSCSAIWLARPRSLRASIPRICVT
jgi:hypothetical protein